MGIDSTSFDEGGDIGPSTASEKPSEKAKEGASSKTLAGIARSRKDESKGKKAANLLSDILVAMLRDPYYDPVVESIMKLLRNDVPSAYVVGAVSLVSKNATDMIRKTYSPGVPLLREPEPEKEKQSFDAGNLRKDFRDRINAWIEDVFLIATKDPSTVLTEKFLAQLSEGSTREIFFEAVRSILTFFFRTKNVEIPHSEAGNLAAFILKELTNRLSKLDLEKIDA